MEYRVTLSLRVEGREGRQHLEREITLPFPPWEGLVVWLPDDDDNGGFPIARVSWDVPGRYFYCQVDPDVDPARPTADLVTYWTSYGWLVT